MSHTMELKWVIIILVLTLLSITIYFLDLKTNSRIYTKPSQIANSGIKTGLFVDVKISKRWH